MSSFPNADDSIVRLAYAVLNGEQPEGTEGIRRLEREDGTAAVYRIDPDASVEPPVDASESGEIPDSEAVLWRADRDRVEAEFERRNLATE